MAKIFFTAVVNNQKHRVRLDDLSQIIKRIKKNKPPVPSFSMEPLVSELLTQNFSEEKND